jgi:hypothetical protein
LRDCVVCVVACFARFARFAGARPHPGPTKDLKIANSKIPYKLLNMASAIGQPYKACSCEEHQNIQWPSSDLNVLPCMTTCPTCGKEFQDRGAVDLRRHLRSTHKLSVLPGRIGRFRKKPRWAFCHILSDLALRNWDQFCRIRTTTGGFKSE